MMDSRLRASLEARRAGVFLVISYRTAALGAPFGGGHPSYQMKSSYLNSTLFKMKENERKKSECSEDLHPHRFVIT